MTFQIQTPRLVLRLADDTLLRAALAGNSTLESLLMAEGASLSLEWPPEHIDNDALSWTLNSLKPPPDDRWGLYFMQVRAAGLCVAGTCGFKGSPDARNCVEVGYSLVPSWQGQGLATEAVLALKSAARDWGAALMAAETLPHLAPSLRVMEKCGLWPTFAAEEEGVVRGECLL